MGDNRNIKRILETMIVHKTKLMILGVSLVCAIVVSAVMFSNRNRSGSETDTQKPNQESQKIKENSDGKESNDKVSDTGLVVADPEDTEQEMEENTVSFVDPEKSSGNNKDTEKDKGNSNNQNDSSNNKNESSGGTENSSGGDETPPEDVLDSEDDSKGSFGTPF